ncbi:hypothetical protein V6O07_23870 [Arthrospira platensis SPKY2]
MTTKTKEEIAKENKEALKLEFSLQEEWNKFLTLINFVDLDKLMNAFKPNKTNFETNFGEIGKKLNKGEITIKQCEELLIELKESLIYKNEEGKFIKLSYPEYRKIIINNIIREFKSGRLGHYYKHEDEQVAYKNPVISNHLIITRYMEESRRNQGLYDNRYYARDIEGEQTSALINPSTILVDLDKERHEKVQYIMSKLNSETISVSFTNVVMRPTGVPGLFRTISEKDEAEILKLTHIKTSSLLPKINLIESSTKKANRQERDQASSLLVNRERGSNSSIIDKIRQNGVKGIFDNGQLQKDTQKLVDPDETLFY